jgi:transcriptional regulator with XRE-family HTH domain
MSTRLTSFGERLRHWRRRRQWSQQALADHAELSARHLSFLETGRAQPSREMVLRLSDRLGVPFRERNPLLEAAGYAPMYRSSAIDEPGMAVARRSLDIVLRSHLPNPALAFDRRYDVIAANDAVAPLLEGAHADLLSPAINVVRISLHPRGLADRIVNFGQWRRHVLSRLRAQSEARDDAFLRDLFDEVSGYPLPAEPGVDLRDEHPGVLLPLQLRSTAGVLSFVSIVTVFGTPHDITLQELAIESFFPADDFTSQQLAAAAAARSGR